MRKLSMAVLFLGAALFTGLGTTSLLAKCDGKMEMKEKSAKCSGEKKMMDKSSKCDGKMDMSKKPSKCS